MKSSSISTVLVGFIPMAAFWLPFVSAAKVQHVEFGSTTILSCNISYLYHTTWFKQNQGLTPTVVLYARLKHGKPFPEYKLSPRFSATQMNRSIALKITGVEERDLGLYYCIADVHRNLMVGSGTELQVSFPGSPPGSSPGSPPCSPPGSSPGSPTDSPPGSSPGSPPGSPPGSSPGFSWSHFGHWYQMVVGLVLLTMVLTVCIIHWKTKADKETTNETPDAIYTYI